VFFGAAGQEFEVHYVRKRFYDKADAVVVGVGIFGVVRPTKDSPSGEHLPAAPIKDADVLAISIANDDEAKAVAVSIGAAKFLDKMNLTQELIPAILELAPKPAAL
jgi:hypothetical protein